MSMVPGTTGKADDIRSNYMLLLVTQLRYQNPLEPMSNDQMTAQLAQLAQLEHLESLDNTFQKALLATQINQAMGMMGKKVAFIPQGQYNAVAGDVQNLSIVDGEVLISVDVTDHATGGTTEHVIGLDAVMAVTEGDRTTLQEKFQENMNNE